MSAIAAALGGGTPSTDALAAQLPQKSPTRRTNPENRPQDKAKNRPQDEPKNRLNIINPVPLRGVIGEGELRDLLGAKKQTAWCSRVRVHGLLLLIDHILRHLKSNGTISISADRAHEFVSKLRVRDHADIPTEPLLLLCRIGIVERKQAAVFAHVRAPAKYCFTDKYRRRRLQVDPHLPAKLASKLARAKERHERRLNRKYRFRKQLLNDLNAVSFTREARSIMATAFTGKGRDNIIRLVSAIDGQNHFVRVSERGQITTSVSNCPRELQPHLLLDGEPVASCDIASAHWNFLPLILANRLDHVSGSPDRANYIGDGWREHNRLVAILSGGDFYRTWCVNPQRNDERDQKKSVLTILLNKKNGECERNTLYRRIRANFPITFRTIEDIKRNDHRNLAKQLHRFTADPIAAALLEVQREGIAAIPLVDALICQEKNRARVCAAIGKQIFERTGVCCVVGGIRCSPLTEEEE